MLISKLPHPPFGYPLAADHPAALAAAHTQALWEEFQKVVPVTMAPEAAAALAAIPGNTAKAHGRPYSTWLFFRVAAAAPDPAKGLRVFLRQCVERAWHTSLGRQLGQWRDYTAAMLHNGFQPLPDDHAAVTGPFGNVLLTRRSLALLDPAGTQYQQLWLEHDAFAHGMIAQRHMLMDRPDPQDDVPVDDPWHGYGFEKEFDLALLLARNTRAGCEKVVGEAVAVATQCGFDLVHRENGFAWKPSGDEIREPFGFRDGISNLLFLLDDVLESRRAGPPVWDPAGAWDQLLFAPVPGSHPAVQALEGGSFVVLRKLEQDVAGLRQWEARNPGRKDPAAILIGRDRDGCPLTGRPAVGDLNNFDFSADPHAHACPFHAHIRKANPRGSSEPPGEERERLFVRRGMAYAPRDRLKLTDRPGETEPKTAAQGVGLLFAGYMGNIDRQFRFMHTAWLTTPTFLDDQADDMDAIVAPKWKLQRGGAGAFVIPRGGGYFFAPPLTWIHQLPY